MGVLDVPLEPDERLNEIVKEYVRNRLPSTEDDVASEIANNVNITESFDSFPLFNLKWNLEYVFDTIFKHSLGSDNVIFNLLSSISELLNRKIENFDLSDFCDFCASVFNDVRNKVGSYPIIFKHVCSESIKELSSLNQKLDYWMDIYLLSKFIRYKLDSHDVNCIDDFLSEVVFGGEIKVKFGSDDEEHAEYFTYYYERLRELLGPLGYRFVLFKVASASLSYRGIDEDTIYNGYRHYDGLKSLSISVDNLEKRTKEVVENTVKEARDMIEGLILRVPKVFTEEVHPEDLGIPDVEGFLHDVAEAAAAVALEAAGFCTWVSDNLEVMAESVASMDEELVLGDVTIPPDVYDPKGVKFLRAMEIVESTLGSVDAADVAESAIRSALEGIGVQGRGGVEEGNEEGGSEGDVEEVIEGLVELLLDSVFDERGGGRDRS